MATQTQTMRRAPVQPERVHDYLYDRNYYVSSERDHARATFQAHTSTDRVKRVPAFNTMFSELRHHPRFEMRLDVTDPVPKFVQRQWRGYADQARDALIRYKTFNYDPSVQVPKQSFPEANVTGQNRYKFFRSYRKNRRHGYGTADEFWFVRFDKDHQPNKPIIPFLQQVPPDVLLATSRQDPLAAGADQQAMLERPPTPLTRTVEIQTDYRDSEAQTDPFTPEYVVRPGSQPELLTLATLSYGRGLPAGLSEVEMIERARAKRAWEATLPPLNDTDQLDKRRKMMDEMERKEWALRESEIEKLQEARLEVLKNLLKTREEHHQELNTKRLDRLWAKKQEMKEEKVKKIRNEHIKTIRKLTEKRRRVEGKLERRDIVHDYSEYGSGVYAPMTRIGVFLDRGSEQFVVKSRFLNSYQGLMELEHSLPDFVTAPRIKAPKPKTVTKSGFVKRKYRQERELAEIHEVIKEQRTRVQEPPKPLRFLQKIEKPIPRPPTPTVDVPSEDEENKELAIIFLQQIIRGRAIQNSMFEGKEKRIELIRELRSTHALQDAEADVKRQEKQATLALQRQRRLHDHKESFVDEALSQLEGESLGDSLDFLSKELVRLQEERRIHAFSMLAERQRRIREAEESGRRQLEERRRREEDEIFKQVVSVHQDTVDTYLEDIIMGAVDSTADEQARKEIEQQASTINDIAYEMEDKRTQLQSEEIVSELVHGFLLPEVQKISMRGKVHLQQRQFLNAAHKEIYRDGEGVIDMYPKAGPTPGSATAPPTATKSLPPTPTGSRPGSAAGRASPKDKPSSGRKSKSPSLEKKSSILDLTVSGEKPSSRPSSAQKEYSTDRPPSSRHSSLVRQSSIHDNQEQVPNSPATSRPPSGKRSRPSSAKDLSRPSSAGRESPKPGSARQSPKPGSARESPKPGSARESPKSGSAKESPKPNSARESPKPGSARESPKPNSARESPKPGSARESPKPGSARESPKPGSVRESPKPGSARESPKPGSARESAKPGSARESPKHPSNRQSPELISEKVSSQPGSARESPNQSARQDSPNLGIARESPKPRSERGSPVQQSQTIESPKPGSARQSPKPDSARESPKPGSAEESPIPHLPDQEKESSKPSSVRGTPEPEIKEGSSEPDPVPETN